MLNMVKFSPIRTIATRTAREKYWRSVEAARKPFYPIITAAVASALDLERVEVGKAVRECGDPAMVPYVVEASIDPDRWLRLLAAIYLRVGGWFASTTYTPQAKADEDEYWWYDYENGLPDDYDWFLPEAYEQPNWWAWAWEYIRSVGADKVVEITDDTKNQIKNIVMAGMQEGDGIDVVARRIDQLYLDEIIPHRSETIARTETIAASNFGNRVGMERMSEEVGVTLEKEWVSTPDDRTRPSHILMDGKRTPFDEPYRVPVLDHEGNQIGEDLLMFPGDGNLGATPGNTINCRCSEVYHAVGGEWEALGELADQLGGKSLKHMSGYHDQGSHGNRYNESGEQTSVGRGSQDQRIYREGPGGTFDDAHVETMRQLEDPKISHYVPTFDNRADGEEYIIDHYVKSFENAELLHTDDMNAIIRAFDEIQEATGLKGDAYKIPLLSVRKDYDAAAYYSDAMTIELGDRAFEGLIPGTIKSNVLARMEQAEYQFHMMASKVNYPYTDEEKTAIREKYKECFEQLKAYERGDKDVYTEHSMFACDDGIEACILHEFGHAWSMSLHDSEVRSFLNANGFTHREMYDKYGVSERCIDGPNELMAENFVMFVKGRTEKMHPDMVKFFTKTMAHDEIIHIGQKHLQGYHDQMLHGSWAAGRETTGTEADASNPAPKAPRPKLEGPGQLARHLEGSGRVKQAEVVAVRNEDIETVARTLDDLYDRYNLPPINIFTIDSEVKGNSSASAWGAPGNKTVEIRIGRDMATTTWDIDREIARLEEQLPEYRAKLEDPDTPESKPDDPFNSYTKEHYRDVIKLCEWSLEHFKAIKEGREPPEVPEKYGKGWFFKYEHSRFIGGDPMGNIIRHEMGHILFMEGEKDIYGFLKEKCNYKEERASPFWDPFSFERDMTRKYAPTSRGNDSIEECIAESFTLYSIGRTDLVHPDMVECFDQFARKKGEKHLQGYHDQMLHGSWAEGRSETDGQQAGDEQHGEPGWRERTAAAEKEAAHMGIIASYNYCMEAKDAETINRVVKEVYAMTGSSPTVIRVRPGMDGQAIFPNIIEIGAANNRPLIEYIKNREDYLAGYRAEEEIAGIDSELAKVIAAARASVKEQREAVERGDYTFYKEHSMYAFRDQIEGTVRHELGHIWYFQHEKEILHDLFKKNATASAKAEKGLDAFMAEKYGPTMRGKDDFHECMAESFTLYSVGLTEKLHPDIIKILKQYTKYKVKLKALVKHLQGYHDQSSHGAWAWGRVTEEAITLQENHNIAPVGRTTDPYEHDYDKVYDQYTAAMRKADPEYRGRVAYNQGFAPAQWDGLQKTLRRDVRSHAWERCYVLDEDAHALVFSKDGTESGIQHPDPEIRAMLDKVYVHGHPTEGSLSEQDFEVFFVAGLREIQAVTPTRTFSVRGQVQGDRAWEWTVRAQPAYKRIKREVVDHYEGRVKRGEMGVFEANVRASKDIAKKFAAEMGLLFKEEIK